MADESTRAASAAVRQELGTLEVADAVFRDLALKAVSDVGGVAGVGRSGGLFRRRSAADAVEVERAEGEVAFAIRLSVRYDVRIPEMVGELRERVKALVEETTGYRVRAVNLTVEHILPPEPQPPRSSASAVPPELPSAPSPPNPQQ